MRKILSYINVILALLITGCSPDTQKVKNPQRIVSLAPSITETIFAIGEGEKVVAVTSYCDYPQKVKALPKIGGLFDASIEEIFGNNPDLVIHLPSQSKTAAKLNALGIKTLSVRHDTIADINASISTISKAINCPQKGTKLLKKLNKASIQPKTQNKKILIVVSRDLSSKSVDSAYMVGQNNWYDDLITVNGCENAIASKIPYPSLSTEGVLTVNPDIIIELIPEAKQKNFDKKTLKALWQENLPSIKAVKNNHIYLISESHAVRPGPRYHLLQTKLAEIIIDASQ